VLIVDDDRDMAEVIKVVLDSAGWSCRVADNGARALDEVAEEMPGVVLLDMLMPVMNGWDCAHRLRERYGQALPIVVMTASEHAETRRDEAGADGVLAKPFGIDELLRIVGAYLPKGDGEPAHPS
jgi:DNA-binding response OmpR family regulator